MFSLVLFAGGLVMLIILILGIALEAVSGRNGDSEEVSSIALVALACFIAAAVARYIGLP